MKQSKTNYVKQNKNPTALESSLRTSTRQQVVDVLTLYKTNTHTHTHKQLRIKTNKHTVFRFWQLSNFGVVQFPKFIIDRRCKTVCCTVRTQISQSVSQMYPRVGTNTHIRKCSSSTACELEIISFITQRADGHFSQLKWNANLLKLHSFYVIIVHVQVHNPTPHKHRRTYIFMLIVYSLDERYSL